MYITRALYFATIPPIFGRIWQMPPIFELFSEMPLVPPSETTRPSTTPPNSDTHHQKLSTYLSLAFRVLLKGSSYLHFFIALLM
jgi:hypothetical protein